MEDAGYYNVSSFIKDLVQEDGVSFKPGTTWPRLVARIRGDRELRALYSQYLEVVEVRIKTEVASLLTQKYGPFGYLDSRNFHSWQRHANFLSNLGRELNRERELFIDTAGGETHDRMSIWSIIDYVSFGILTKSLYRAMKDEDKVAIARAFGIEDECTFSGYLRSLTVVRNVCAHHSRLFRRRFVDTCPVQQEALEILHDVEPGATVDTRSMFAVTLALITLLPEDEALNFIAGLSDFSAGCEPYDLHNCGFNSLWPRYLADVVKSRHP
ncbi:MAG: Abi family protein [Corynebacterium sp.]|nr:Abi family protein [Corynebacterium sp.]